MYQQALIIFLITFWYKNARSVVTEFNEWSVKLVRNTMIPLIIITSGPFCWSLPVWLIHWTTANRTDFKVIVVVFLRSTNIVLMYKFLFKSSLSFFFLLRLTFPNMLEDAISITNKHSQKINPIKKIIYNLFINMQVEMKLR